MIRSIVCAALLLTSSAAAETNADLKEQVRKTEIAFAKTLADRNAVDRAQIIGARK